MNDYTKQLANELRDCGRMPMFEISVVNTDGEHDWVTCDISFQGDSIVAQRDAVSKREQRSRYIASDRVVVDSCLSLDDHLQALHESVLDSINNGDLWTLADPRYVPV